MTATVDVTRWRGMPVRARNSSKMARSCSCSSSNVSVDQDVAARRAPIEGSAPTMDG